MFKNISHIFSIRTFADPANKLVWRVWYGHCPYLRAAGPDSLLRGLFKVIQKSQEHLNILNANRRKQRNILGGLVWTLSLPRGSWARPPLSDSQEVERHQEHRINSMIVRNIVKESLEQGEHSRPGNIPANRGTARSFSWSKGLKFFLFYVFVKVLSKAYCDCQRKTRSQDSHPQEQGQELGLSPQIESHSPKFHLISKAL